MMKIQKIAALDKSLYDEAIANYSKAIELKPNDAEAYSNRGVAYSHKGEFDQAISDYNRALQINPNDDAAYMNRGGAYAEKKLCDQAISDFTKAIELNPKDAEAYDNRGSAYADKGESDQAISDYSKAIELDPKDPQSYNDRGYAYFKKGRYDKAISDYDRALKIKPTYTLAQENRELALKAKGQSGHKTMSEMMDEAMEKVGKDSTHKSESTDDKKILGAMVDEAMANVRKDSKKTVEVTKFKPANETTETHSLVENSGKGAAATPDTVDWCDRLLKAPIDKNLPKGYSHPEVSLTEMTATERAGGMLCKISVTLQGPDRFNAIRYRVYENAAAAERGLNSLAKGLPPDITVMFDKVHYEGAPCMVYTAGDGKLTFVTCADQIEGKPIVVSGVSSQPTEGNGYGTDTVGKAGGLLDAGIHSFQGMVLGDVWEKIFGKDKKK